MKITISFHLSVFIDDANTHVVHFMPFFKNTNMTHDVDCYFNSRVHSIVSKLFISLSVRTLWRTDASECNCGNSMYCDSSAGFKDEVRLLIKGYFSRAISASRMSTAAILSTVIRRRTYCDAASSSSFNTGCMTTFGDMLFFACCCFDATELLFPVPFGVRPFSGGAPTFGCTRGFTKE